ncbi:hypothetical protein MNBD_BACTEROID01-48 [hydrothermal vent metagenome]|uniref:Uncharacterized protein n=1 Tax=hydrothermal vent metagenome TaxID=652676 RepID=A0A3B0UF46_9ZZZZ
MIIRERPTSGYYVTLNSLSWDIASNYLPENKIQIDKIIDNEK